jgi:hypothetical protein
LREQGGPQQTEQVRHSVPQQLLETAGVSRERLSSLRHLLVRPRSHPVRHFRRLLTRIRARVRRGVQRQHLGPGIPERGQHSRDTGVKPSDSMGLDDWGVPRGRAHDLLAQPSDDASQADGLADGPRLVWHPHADPASLPGHAKAAEDGHFSGRAAQRGCFPYQVRRVRHHLHPWPGSSMGLIWWGAMPCTRERHVPLGTGQLRGWGLRPGRLLRQPGRRGGRVLARAVPHRTLDRPRKSSRNRAPHHQRPGRHEPIRAGSGGRVGWRSGGAHADAHSYSRAGHAGERQKAFVNIW